MIFFKKVNQISLGKKIIILALLLGLAVFSYRQITSSKTIKSTYQTATAEKQTLISSVSASGSITSGNNLSVTTSATGTVKNVYVKNGDTVKMGQKIAEISLDQDGLQKQSQAWASYLSAKNNLESSRNKLHSLQSAEFTANQKFINDAVARDLTVDDPTYIEENANWLQAEADYKNQFNVISQSQASLTNSWYSYQQVSPIITAPASGVISNLMITSGTVISSSTTSSGSSVSQKLATIKSKQNENPQAEVTLSEIDATKVSPGQKVTITMDAFPDKSFTGKVLIVDTNGEVSSGVVSYPATIQFDTSEEKIYPNMGVNARIITEIKDNVLVVPSSSIQSVGGQKNVRVLQNGQITNLPVEIGLIGDTETEIVSGLNEGDAVVTSIITSGSTSTTRNTTSPFGGTNRGFGGGSGAVFLSR